MGEFLQRKLASAERSEKNQRALLSVAAGLLCSGTVSSNLPTRIRVAHSATELRTAEWQTAAPLFESHGTAKSFHEKTIVSLRHDIIYPNHDRDYRILSLFSAPLLSEAGFALRIFDVLHSGSGDAILQINIIGSLEDGHRKGFIDLIATSGHMRWLKPGNETPPRDRTHWLGELTDFAAVRPWQDIQVLFDEDRGDVDSTPWLTCRQCRRKEKGPPHFIGIFRAVKLTETWPNAMSLENSHTRGYPVPIGPTLPPVNPTFPIMDHNWRNTTEHHSCADSFWMKLNDLFRWNKPGQRLKRGTR